MALTDDLFNSGTAKGLAIGLGTALVAPVAASALSGFGRPVARAAIKSGIIFYDKGRETLAEMGEVFEDLVAEAQAELEADRHQGHPPEEEPGTDQAQAEGGGSSPADPEQG
ncbi:DUF5132 domain-containing protein [Thiohalorhabdus methylotrophus]|uniref:DUF5132 domain-containing protein n=1 Tax=Thiohalorhabdus methylotrophus TaxID=3242694 RepID=A0ABV4TQI3_9GAMM